MILNNGLVEINNNQVVVSSRDIAEHFEKEHKNVLRNIDELVAQNSATKDMFLEATREYRGQNFRYFLMNRDGFSLLVMGFTGKKALEWKLKYIEAFNAMEQHLSEQKYDKKEPPTEYELRELAIKERDAKIREAQLWEKLGSGYSGTFQQVCMTYAVNTLAEKEIVELPIVNRKTYTATEIGNILGISANKVGKLANKYGLKTSKYGQWYHDKSRYSNKEIEAFRYYDNIIDTLRSKIL